MKRVKDAIRKQPTAAAVSRIGQRNAARRRAQAARSGSPKGEISTGQFPFSSEFVSPRGLWNAYLRVSWVRACVNVIARTATSRGWGFRGAPASCLRARDILSRPNPQDSGRDLLVNVFEDMEIYGRGFWELVRAKAGDRNSPVVSIYTLDPIRTKPKPDKRGKIIGYEQVTSKGEKIMFEPWEIVYFPLSTKGSEAQGISPLQSLFLPVTTDIHAQNYNLSFFKNHALPAGVLTMEGAPSDVVQRNRDYLESESQGPENAHKHLLLEGKVDFKEWQKTPKDADFLKLRSFNRDEIISVYGVPPAKIGIIETGNIGAGSGGEQDKTFKKDTVEPTQGQVAERINRFFIEIALEIFDCEFFFLPIDTETEKETAEIDETKATTRKLDAETAKILIESEIWTPQEAKIFVPPPNLKEASGKALFVIESSGKNSETGFSRVKEVHESPKRKGISAKKEPDLRALVNISKGSPRPFRPEKWLEKSERFKKTRKAIVDELNRWKDRAVAAVRATSKSSRPILKQDPAEILRQAIDEGRLAEILGIEIKESYKVGAGVGLSEAGLSPESFTPRPEDFEGIEARVTVATSVVAEGIKNSIRLEIAEGIKLGEGIDRIAARVEGVWGKAVSYNYTAFGKEITRTLSADAWSTLVARTETLRALNDGRWAAFKANDVKLVNIQLTLGAEAECISLAEGGPYALGDAEGLLPVHPNCLLPGNKVIASDAVAGYKGVYNGRCIEIRTAGGHCITITENHPILTPGGFLAAKHLSKGDYVLGSTDGQRVAAGINPDNDNGPALIEEIFSALEKSRSMSTSRVKVSPEYLHGDGRFLDGDIDVVYAESLLLRNAESGLAKPVCKDIFSKYGSALSRLFALRSQEQFAFASSAASPSGIGLRNEMPSPGQIGLRHPQIHRFGATTGNKTSFLEPTNYSRPTYTELLGQFLDRFSALVKADEIVDIKPFSFRGHVYDLHAFNYRLYNCGGIYVKNCRCTIVPAPPEQVVGDKGPQTVLDEARA